MLSLGGGVRLWLLGSERSCSRLLWGSGVAGSPHALCLLSLLRAVELVAGASLVRGVTARLLVCDDRLEREEALPGAGPLLTLGRCGLFFLPAWLPGLTRWEGTEFRTSGLELDIGRAASR